MKYERGEIVFLGEVTFGTKRTLNYKILSSNHKHSRMRCTETLRIYNKVPTRLLTSETEYNMEKYNL